MSDYTPYVDHYRIKNRWKCLIKATYKEQGFSAIRRVDHELRNSSQIQ